MAYRRSYGPRYNRGRGRGGKRNRSPFARTGGRGGSGTKVSISNLDSGVTDGDVREIFQQVGRVSKTAVNYDSNGRSRGTAEVTFANRQAAIKAVKEYDRAEVDGRPMFLTLIGGGAVQKVVQRAQTFQRRRTPVRRSGRGRGGRGSNGRGANGRGSGRGGRRSRSRAVKKTAEQLDAEMDDYHGKAGGEAGQLDREMDEYHNKAGQPKGSSSSSSSTGFAGQPPALNGMEDAEAAE